MKHLSCLRLALAASAAATSLMLGGTAAAAGSPRPDDRAVHGVELIAPSAVRTDDLATHGLQQEVSIEQVATPAGAQGFDWSDAGIGAATVIGLGLVGGGACVLVLRRRRAAAFS